LNVYRRNGVREYIVWRTVDRQIDQFVLRGSEFVRSAPDSGGVLRSEIFAGLWLDGPAMLAGDKTKFVEVLQQGVASSEHAAYVQRLGAAAKP
jgi:hypothetical protein